MLEQIAKPTRVRKAECDSFDEVQGLVNLLLQRTQELAVAVIELQKPKVAKKIPQGHAKK